MDAATVNLIKSGNVVDVDFEHVLEEIESMGASERRELINSVLLAAKETGLDESAFPVQCPYAQADLLNSEFYPEP